jgi:uncharacterized cupin superfamily protein
MEAESKRPDFVRHCSAIEEPVGEGDLFALVARFGQKLGLRRIGINLETVPPGCRRSEPHAHEREEEFVYVIEGRPDAWIDGELHALGPGDGMAFSAGTGVAHCLLNNTNEPVRLLIVGERHPDDRILYPLMPERRSAPDHWQGAPVRPLGPHDGRPTTPRR